MERFYRLSLVLAFAIALSACGGDTDPLVAFEAHWQCDVQRQSFASMDAIDEAFEEALNGAGLTRADYESFRARLAESSSIRDQVATEYDAYCTS